MPSDKYLYVAAIATIGHRLIASPSVDRFFGGCLPAMCIATGVPRVGQLLSFWNVIGSLPIISPKIGGLFAVVRGVYTIFAGTIFVGNFSFNLRV
jgi:hypothetical protein